MKPVKSGRNKTKPPSAQSCKARTTSFAGRGKDRYENIDSIIKTPAWERNKVKFVPVSDTTRQTGKVTLEKTAAEQPAEKKENSLFDDIQ